MKGTLSVVADTLTRMFETVEPQSNLPSIVAPILYDMPLTFTDLRSHQAQDPEDLDIIQRLEAGEYYHPIFHAGWVALLYCQI
jgi:hypothetical protein